MPATAVTRPAPTEGPRLRNLRLLGEAAPWGTAAVASGFTEWGRAPPRRRPWAAAGTPTQTASIRLKKATGRRERRSIAASCSGHAATEKGERALSYTGTKRPLDRVAPVTLPVTSGSGRALERNPVDAERPHKARNSRQLPGLAFLPPSRTIKRAWGLQGGGRPALIRRVDYYSPVGPAREGEGRGCCGAPGSAGSTFL